MSLAKYKRDKITEALLDKGYQRHPELELNLAFLWEKFYVEELKSEVNPIMHNWIGFDDDIMSEKYPLVSINFPDWVPHDGDFEKIKRELADLSNMIDYVFDRILVIEKKWEEIIQ